jgi:hypothetical protein
MAPPFTFATQNRFGIALATTYRTRIRSPFPIFRLRRHGKVSTCSRHVVNQKATFARVINLLRPRRPSQTVRLRQVSSLILYIVGCKSHELHGMALLWNSAAV